MGFLDTISTAELAARTEGYGHAINILFTATATGVAIFAVAGALDGHMEGTTPAVRRRNCTMGLDHAYSPRQT